MASGILFICRFCSDFSPDPVLVLLPLVLVLIQSCLLWSRFCLDLAIDWVFLFVGLGLDLNLLPLVLTQSCPLTLFILTQSWPLLVLVLIWSYSTLVLFWNQSYFCIGTLLVLFLTWSCPSGLGSVLPFVGFGLDLPPLVLVLTQSCPSHYKTKWEPLIFHDLPTFYEVLTSVSSNRTTVQNLASRHWS